MHKDESGDTVEYYLGFSGYNHPVRAKQRVSEEEAKKHEAYYVASFDRDRKLLNFEKHLHGEVVFEYAYSYHPNGVLMLAEIVDREGQMTTQHFDESGRLRVPEQMQ